MTEQEILDQVVEGMSGQGWKKSVRPGDRCNVYHNYDGTSCSLGHLFPKDDSLFVHNYKSNGVFIGSLHAFVNPEKRECWDREFGPHMNLLTQLQTAHDSSSSPHQIWRRTRDVAETFNLKFDAPPPPEE